MNGPNKPEHLATTGPEKHFQPEPTLVEHLSGYLLCGRLLALLVKNRIG